MDATQYREACETVQREAEEAVKLMQTLSGRMEHAGLRAVA